MNPTTPTNPVPPVVPEPPTTPVQVPVPTPGQVPSTPMTPSQPASFNSTANSGGKKKLFIVGGVVALLLVLIAVFVVLPAMASLQAKSRADGFMKAITAGDVPKAMTFVENGGDSEDKEFLEAAAAKVKGTFTYKESTKQDDKYYALYDLNAGDYKAARTEMKNVSGKWYLDGFVYDTQALKLIPGSSTTESPSKTTVETETTPTVSGECLSDQDVATLTGAVGGVDITDNDYKVKYREYLDNFYFFNSNNTDFENADSSNENIQQVVTFYNTYKNKNFTIHLAGQVHRADDTVEGRKLSNQRSERVKAALVAKGVATDRVLIDEPDPASDADPDGSARSVELTIRAVNACQSDQ